MEVVKIDTMGLRCPHPTLVLSNTTQATPPGALVEIRGDCPTFEKDIREYCQKRKKTVIAVSGKPPNLTIQIQF